MICGGLPVVSWLGQNQPFSSLGGSFVGQASQNPQTFEEPGSQTFQASRRV